MTMKTATDTSQLVSALATVPAATLQGLELLEKLQPQSGTWLPTSGDIDQIVAATEEFIDFTKQSQRLTEFVLRLRPVPLSICPPEFHL